MVSRVDELEEIAKRVQELVPESERPLTPEQAQLSLRVSAAAATAAFIAGVLAVPEALGDNGRHQLFANFFGTSAQVIATLLVALVIEGRSMIEQIRFVLPIVGYIGAGLSAAVAGTSPSLPEPLYPWALAMTLAGGTGALVTTLLIAFWSIEHRLGAPSGRPVVDEQLDGVEFG